MILRSFLRGVEQVLSEAEDPPLAGLPRQILIKVASGPTVVLGAFPRYSLAGQGAYDAVSEMWFYLV